MRRPNPLLHLLVSTRTGPAQRSIIAEPATSLTDLALAGQTFTYASRLRTGQARSEASALLWALALAAAGAAALAGALTHALYEDAGLRWVRVVRGAAWKVVSLATAAASAFMLAGSIVGAMPPGRRAPYVAAAAIKAGIFAVAAWRSGNFLFTILDYATSMLAVLALQVRNWQTGAAAPWLSGGVLVAFVAAAIQRSHFAVHRRFNHNDLYHLVQMGAFHLLYEGARRQQDWNE